MTQNAIIKQMQYDQGTGALTYRDVRYLLIRPETIVGFQKSVETYSPQAAREALFQGGYQGGYLSTQKYKEAQNLSDREAIAFMMNMGAEIGWGHFKLLEYDRAHRKLQVRVENSAFATAYGPSAEGVCHIVRGVISGMATVLFKQECKASETMCLAKRDQHCVFKVLE